jgi:FHS family L-fucose permease-like MFS transporter
LGSKDTGSQRLSLAGGINNVGTTLGPVLISFAIFGSLSAKSSEVSSIEAVKTPYLILGAAFVLVSILIYFSNIPNHLESDETETNVVEDKAGSVFKYPQLVFLAFVW